MKKYRAIFFDLGWTLVDLPNQPKIKLQLQEILGDETFQKVRTVFHAWHTALWTLDEFFSRVESIVPLTDTLRALLAGWGGQAEFVPYPETIATLKAIKDRGVLIGVISNAPPLSSESIAQMRLTDYVDAWTFSHELGVEKPDSRIFQVALTKLGVTADEALMVGDSLDKDVLGARAAGIDAIQIVRPGTVSDEPEQIADLHELLVRLAETE